MNTQSVLNGSLLEGKISLPYQDADTFFAKIYRQFPNHFLMESKQVSLFSGRFSLIGIDAALHVKGKDDDFEINSLNERGLHYLSQVPQNAFSICDEINRNDSEISGSIFRDESPLEESQRCKKKNIAEIIRILLNHFYSEQKVLMGLYGAFSYDFIRLYEDINDSLPENTTPDFSLFLYDSFFYFDHIKEESFLVIYRDDGNILKYDAERILEICEASNTEEYQFSVHSPSFSTPRKYFEEVVRFARQQIKEGELFQVVFSQILKAHFEGSPFALYQSYRLTNPSPYLFYYQLDDEYLIGASPEMMVRCEDGKVHLRPIAGTIARGKDPMDDHDQLLTLLSDPKERAELDMLIDLGRNDLSRICKPGITISDYRFVEKYSRVMHTVAHLTGELKEDYSGFDALISCLNAGTLTGAPKVASMRTIEKKELERRGYYGGTLGQLSFSGEVDTAILIRTAHIKNNELLYQSGAGIVYDSDPEKEYEESIHKAHAFLDAIQLTLPS